jgi:hypothetical protein
MNTVNYSNITCPVSLQVIADCDCQNCVVARIDADYETWIADRNFNFALGMESMAIQPTQPTPMSLIQMAVSKGADANQLAVLMDLQLRWEANESKKAFEDAFSKFKANAPTIIKTKKVSFANSKGDKTEYNHAELDKITDILDEALRGYGIIKTWKTSDANGRTTVTCILKGYGHTEEGSTLSGPSDTSGGKNNIQAIGSTVTYLQRYTLLTTCGIAATSKDDDGKTEGMSEEAITDYCIQMQDCSSMAELQKSFAEAYQKSKDAKDPEAQQRFIKVKETRKKELNVRTA